MRFRPRFAASLALLVLAALLCPTSLSAGTLGMLQEKINTAISPGDPDTRVPAASAVTEAWQHSLQVLIQNIGTYYQSDGKSYSDEAVAKLLPLTDLLVAIVETKDGAVERFREADTNQTIEVLTWATGSDNRDLRLNASRILYKWSTMTICVSSSIGCATRSSVLVLRSICFRLRCRGPIPLRVRIFRLPRKQQKSSRRALRKI